MSMITSLQRGGKSVQVKSRAVDRTYTTATLVAQLPRGSRILGFVLSGVASDAETTATLSVGSTTASNEYVSAANVLAAGIGNGVTLLNGVAGAVGSTVIGMSGGPIYVKYAETGTASTVGSWILHIVYTTGNDLDDDSGNGGA